MSALTRFFFALALAASATAAAALSATQAADGIRYVSTTGKNTNNCTLTAPCRTLQRAINLAPAGGEVRILDSGFYGNSSTIRKSLTISGNGYTVALGAPMVINDASAVVALRGLVLDGQGAVQDGIKVAAAAAVHVERCIMYGFIFDGIQASADGVELFVADSVARDNGGSGITFAVPSTRLTINNSRFENNRSLGVAVLSGSATIRHSVVSGNRGGGVAVSAASASIDSTMAAQNGSVGFSAVVGAAVTIESSTASGNGLDGLLAFNGAVARISNSTFTRNATGIRNNAGTVETLGNNTIRGNTTDVTGTLTAVGAL